MRLVLSTVAALALVATAPGLVGSALAHGGAYRGPAGEVPPDSREPSDPPPPPSGGGPSTPGGEPGGPSTGGDVGGGPSTGGGSGGPSTGGGGGGPSTGSGPSGPTTGGGGGGMGKRAGSKGPGYEDWTFWWNFNKDEILQLKSQVKKQQSGKKTGTSLHRFGGRTAGSADVVSTTDAAIQTQIVPALRAMLEEKDLNFDIQSAAAIALAKIGDESIVDVLKKMAVNKDSSYHRVVEESASLSFGLLQKQTEEIREFLIEVVQNKDQNASFARPFAAVSLGVLGTDGDRDRKVAEALLSVLAGKESKQDVKPACLVALGLLGDDKLVPELLQMLEQGKVNRPGADSLNDTEMAFVVNALGKIGSPGTAEDPQAVIEALKKSLDGKREKNVNVRRSAAIALGQVAPACDQKVQKEIVDLLTDTARDGKDSSERNFAMTALGRVGATQGVDPKTREKCMDALTYLLAKAKPSTIGPPFAGLSLGLIGRQIMEEGGQAPEEKVRQPLREQFEATSDPRARGSYAIASGLVRDPLAVEALVKSLQDRGTDPRLRGYCALALGMIGDTAAKEAIAKVLADEDENDRNLRVQTAVAAGLIGDAGVIDALVKLLQTEDSQYILGSVALALGQIGDENAIAALLEIAQDPGKKYPDLTRALATVALGQIGDRRDTPTLSRLAKDINYRAHVPALAELLTIL